MISTLNKKDFNFIHHIEDKEVLNSVKVMFDKLYTECYESLTNLEKAQNGDKFTILCNYNITCEDKSLFKGNYYSITEVIKGEENKTFFKLKGFGDILFDSCYFNRIVSNNLMN